MNGRHGHRVTHIPQQGFGELQKPLCREQAGKESEKFQPRQPRGLAVVLQGLCNDRELIQLAPNEESALEALNREAVAVLEDAVIVVSFVGETLGTPCVAGDSTLWTRNLTVIVTILAQPDRQLDALQLSESVEAKLQDAPLPGVMGVTLGDWSSSREPVPGLSATALLILEAPCQVRYQA